MLYLCVFGLCFVKESGFESDSITIFVTAVLCYRGVCVQADGSPYFMTATVLPVLTSRVSIATRRKAALASIAMHREEPTKEANGVFFTRN